MNCGFESKWVCLDCGYFGQNFEKVSHGVLGDIYDRRCPSCRSHNVMYFIDYLVYMAQKNIRNNN